MQFGFIEIETTTDFAEFEGTFAGQGIGCIRNSDRAVLEPVMTYKAEYPPEKNAYDVLKDMRRLTLLSGNNNVGKSSVLEAIFLMMDHLSPDSFTRMNSIRGLSLPSNGVGLWEPLFYQMNPDNTIRIHTTRAEDTLTLSYAKDESYIPALNGGIPKNVAGSFQSSAKRDYTLRFDFKVEGSVDYSEIGHYTTSENCGILTHGYDKEHKNPRRDMRNNYIYMLRSGTVVFIYVLQDRR